PGSWDDMIRPSLETQIGLSLGTPGYMAPEQALGKWEEVDHRTDLFSVGAILYEILTGQKPFVGENVTAIIRATLDQEPTRPRELSPHCPLVLEDLCLKLLSKRIEDRPGSAEMIVEELEAFLEGTKERSRRRDEAKRLCDQAKVPLARFHKLGETR